MKPSGSCRGAAVAAGVTARRARMARRTERMPGLSLGGRSSLAAGAILAVLAPLASAQQPGPDERLRSTIAAQMAQGPRAAGAYVVDLTDGHVVFDDRSDERRLSASVTKLYTTSTALIELGRRTRVSTRVLGTGRRNGATLDRGPVPARRRGLHVRHRGVRPEGLRIQARASSGWPARAAPFRTAADPRPGVRRYVALQRQRRDSVRAGPLPRSAVRARLSVRSRRQARAADPERPAYADRLRPRACGARRARRRSADPRGSPRAG